MKYIKEHIGQTLVLLIFVGLAFLALYLSFAYESDQWVIKDSQFGRFLAHTLINIAPELAGIVIGVVTIDYLNEKRQDDQLKRQLILQMGSRHNDVTDTAMRTMKSYGWLSDGSLKGADLNRADLSGVSLREANLSEANLHGANLSGTSLRKADLSGTKLSSANLSGANLYGVNLSGAELNGSDLSGAFPIAANLSGANLWGVDLSGTNLREANLSEADLSKANLSEANLYAANLSKADLSEAINLTNEQVSDAESFAEATMPDGRKYEEWI